MEKRPAGAWPFRPCPYLPSARRRLMTERSERMSEEAENHQNVQ
ncbi:hypothetical protein ACSG2U_004709 [Escherichia coli]